MNSYTIENNIINEDTANEIQSEILSGKLDNNPLMVENSSERKNKNLSSEFFSSSSKTIVNAINKTYKNSQDALARANDSISLIKETIGNIEDLDTKDKLNNLKAEAEANDLIGIIDHISKKEGTANLNEVELTQEEYNALSEEEKLNGTTYFIKDAVSIPGAIDSEMSDASNNAVKNKTIKKYIDDKVKDLSTEEFVLNEISKIPSTIDSEMSDTSENMVSNKVIKKYVDDSIPDNLRIDSEMSDTSTRPVQNKILKKYVDDSVIYVNQKIEGYDTLIDDSYNNSSEANTNAATALTKATTAESNASTAKSDASTAKTNAATALTKANDAKTNADNVVLSFSELNSDLTAKITNLENLIKSYQKTNNGVYIGNTEPSDTTVIWIDTNY